MISDDEDLMAVLHQLAMSVQQISHGHFGIGPGGSTPLGLEGVSMALCGQGTPGVSNNVASGLHDIADAVRTLAEAVNGLHLAGKDVPDDPAIRPAPLGREGGPR